MFLSLRCRYLLIYFFLYRYVSIFIDNIPIAIPFSSATLVLLQKPLHANRMIRKLKFWNDSAIMVAKFQMNCGKTQKTELMKVTFSYLMRSKIFSVEKSTFPFSDFSLSLHLSVIFVEIVKNICAVTVVLETTGAYLSKTVIF